MYPARDANFNVTALIDTSGTVQERYFYDPYGRRTILDGSWGAQGSSSYDWTLGHQGLMLDTETGLYHNRARMLHATLGRFVQRDPLGYVDGPSPYHSVGGNPITSMDPHGMDYMACARVPSAPCFVVCSGDCNGGEWGVYFWPSAPFYLFGSFPCSEWQRLQLPPAQQSQVA